MTEQILLQQLRDQIDDLPGKNGCIEICGSDCILAKISQIRSIIHQLRVADA